MSAQWRLSKLDEGGPDTATVVFLSFLEAVTRLHSGRCLRKALGRLRQVRRAPQSAVSEETLSNNLSSSHYKYHWKRNWSGRERVGYLLENGRRQISSYTNVDVSPLKTFEPFNMKANWLCSHYGRLKSESCFSLLPLQLPGSALGDGEAEMNETQALASRTPRSSERLTRPQPHSVLWEMPHLGPRAVTQGAQRMALRLAGLTGRDVSVGLAHFPSQQEGLGAEVPGRAAEQRKVLKSCYT